MNRRQVIQSLALAAGSTFFLGSCKEANVLDLFTGGTLNLDKRHKNYLDHICNAFLPLGEYKDQIPTASTYIMTMLNDCSDIEDRQKFAAGFEKYKLFMEENKLKIKSQNTTEITGAVIDLLENKNIDEDLEHFIGTTRWLSISNLRNSKFYRTEYLEYQMIPPAYENCSVS